MSVATTVVAIPSYSALSRVFSNTRRFANRIAVLRRLPLRLSFSSIPKGQVQDGEALWDVAVREFGEETGHVVGSNARTIELGRIRQRGGKTVHVWAVEGDMDPTQAWSNTFRMEWPPRSGIFIEVPELDRVAWFAPEAARVAMNPAQAPLVDLLLQAFSTEA